MYLEFKYCPVCKKETAHGDGDCGDCAKRREASEQVAKDAAWQSLTTDEKLDLLRRRIDLLVTRGHYQVDG